jgi:uncharacterized RDD family membrane protein YckC
MTSAQPRSSGVWARFAAMVYEGVLLFGVVFIVSYLVLGLMRWTYPLAPGPRTVLQVVLFVTIGAYFVWCWCRSGQTLAMKSWHLRLVDERGALPSTGRAVMRYLAAWVMFAPGLVYLLLAQPGAAQGTLALLASFVLMFVPALLDGQGRLLQDRLSGTCVVRAEGKTRTARTTAGP